MDGLQPVTQAVSPILLAVIVAAGEPVAMRFIEFFTANIRNPSICKAYA